MPWCFDSAGGLKGELRPTPGAAEAPDTGASWLTPMSFAANLTKIVAGRMTQGKLRSCFVRKIVEMDLFFVFGWFIQVGTFCFFGGKKSELADREKIAQSWKEKEVQWVRIKQEP